MSRTQQQSLEELDAQIQFLERLLRIDEARDDLLKFTQLTMPDPQLPDDATRSQYKPARHHEAMAQALQEVDQGKIQRLIITQPPRHGKSEIVSRRFPPWFIGRDKSRQVIFATYNQDFADDFGRKWREIITSQTYKDIFPGVEPKTDTRAAARMEIKDGGLAICSGIGGAITGRGSDLLLIDDPIKNREEAESLTYRDRAWEWFSSTAYTRLMPGGRIVIIATRWHEDDLIGRLLSRDYMSEAQIRKWVHLDLPAIAYENTPNEQALWPERFPLHVLKETRDMVGSRDWNALYQQRPTPPEGAFFDRDQIESNLYNMDQLPKSGLTFYTGFDLAVSSEKKRDRTCCLSCGLDENDVLWLMPEIYWERRDADESVEFIAEHIRHYNPMTVYCEKGKLDKAVGPFLEKYLADNKIYQYFEKMPSVTKKGARATAIRGRIAAGMVKFPREAPWWPAALDEMLKFSGEGDDKSDDFVDALALIGQGLHRQVYTSQESKPAEGDPKVGTLGWAKADADRRRKMLKAMGNNAGW